MSRCRLCLKKIFILNWFTLYQRLSSSKEIEAFTPEGEHYLCLAGSFTSSSTGGGYLLLSSYEKSLRENQATRRMLTLLSLTGILLCSLLIWVLIRKITRPLRQLSESAEAVGRGDFSRRVEVIRMMMRRLAQS